MEDSGSVTLDFFIIIIESVKFINENCINCLTCITVSIADVHFTIISYYLWPVKPMMTLNELMVGTSQHFFLKHEFKTDICPIF